MQYCWHDVAVSRNQVFQVIELFMHTLQHDKQTKIEVYYIYMPWQLITKHTQRNNYSPATQDAKYDLIDLH